MGKRGSTPIEHGIGEMRNKGMQLGPAEDKLPLNCKQTLRNAEVNFAEMGGYKVNGR